MRALFLCGWLLVPVCLGAYHYGPGVQQMELDNAGNALVAAQQAVESQQYAQAVDFFTKALEELPHDRVDEARSIRLERAKAQLNAQQLPTAYNELSTLLTELEADKDSDKQILSNTRGAMASAQYYVTWLMRLEGRPRNEWEPEIEGSRQLYRLLAEEADEKGDVEVAKSRQQDLEASIRLARLDLSQLQALPLPSQCKNCCSGSCNCKCKGKKPGKKPGNKKSEDARGAGAGPPPDGKGN